MAKTRTAVGEKHDRDTKKHGLSGLKSPAVETVKHGRAGRLKGARKTSERVEIPSRRAGETRLSGAPKRGGAPLKADVKTQPQMFIFRVRQA